MLYGILPQFRILLFLRLPELCRRVAVGILVVFLCGRWTCQIFDSALHRLVPL